MKLSLKKIRSVILVMSVAYIISFITIVVLNVEEILPYHAYLCSLLYLILDVGFLIPIFYVAFILNVINARQWVKISYYIFIALHIVNLFISFIPVSFRTEMSIASVVGSVITAYSIYLAISLFFVRNETLSGSFKAYAWSIFTMVVYTYTITLVMAYFINPYLYLKVSQFTSLAGIFPMLGIFYIAYRSKYLVISRI